MSQPSRGAKHPMRVFAFGTAGAYVAGRSVADGVFLGELGADLLPLLYVVSAILSTMLAFLFALAVRRISVWRVSQGLLVAEACLTALSAVIIERAPHQMAAVLLVFVLAEVRGVVGTVLMSTLLSEAFSVERAKRNVGSIHGFSTLAGIVIGAMVGLEATWLENHRILYFASGLELMAATSIGFIERKALPSEATAQTTISIVDAIPRDCSSNRESWLMVAAALLIVLRTTVGLLVEFQWKSSASGLIAEPESLTQFFGAFYSVMYLLTGMLQWTLTKRVLQRQGIGGALSVLPLGLLAATSYGLTCRTDFALLRAISLAKACDVFRRAFFDPAVQLVPAPLPAELRRRTNTLLNGVVKPLTEITVGLLLLDFVRAITSRQLILIVWGLIAVWLVATHVTKRLFDSATKDLSIQHEMPHVDALQAR